MSKHTVQKLSWFETNFQNIVPKILHIQTKAQHAKITTQYIPCVSTAQISEMKLQAELAIQGL